MIENSNRNIIVVLFSIFEIPEKIVFDFINPIYHRSPFALAPFNTCALP